MKTRLLAATALVVLAALLVLVAADVRSWPAALAGGDVVYASSPARAAWTPQTQLGGVAGTLLAADDDVALRRALRLYRIAAALHPTLENATQAQTARVRAQDALLSVAASVDATRAAQARTLLGVLTFGASATGREQSQVESAVADFTDAIRTDPANADAKFDLELLLRLSAAHGTRRGQGIGGAFGRGGRRSGGGGIPGKGY